MKLTDLDPRWFYFDGRLAGLTFLCPRCRKARLSAKTVILSIREQCIIFARDFPANEGEIVPSKEGFTWTIVGMGFADLTVAPSIDASNSKHWHGTITNGEAKP
jgi:hypothetical protein